MRKAGFKYHAQEKDADVLVPFIDVSSITMIQF